ncbi:hypothetical protein L6164_001995 [Bauhinia variegata]|uniref:Uncharacterized protein n=1 Tax=Bauhinia variegata TaxID=167791 RepID=A0ACB9PWP1_BAUVA|nr:hypothetical protein L6164_001995 [Bauhinia variegata]
MAAEGIAADVAANIIATLIKKAVSQAQYLFCFNNIIETLEKEKDELIQKQERTEERAEWAHRRTERIDVEVQNWLKDAENLKTEVSKLQEETDKHNAARWCPNCIQHYRLGKRMAKKTKELRQLKGNCNFSQFARLATLRGMEYYSSESFISFESRKRAYDQIMEALKDDGIRRIGVHGMGGCGKTTLVKEVGKEAEKQRLFEKVLTVVVSNDLDTRKVQASIAGSLGLTFRLEENEPERARRLCMALSNRGKILVILDDVWERLDFEFIGIPNTCYIVLTTRNSSICNIMECQKVISLSVLDDTESWILFQKHAAITNDNIDTFKDVGRDIARECKGLPVAIAAVAGSLKGKEFVEWGEACAMLRDSGQVDIEPGFQDPYKCLQLSYDNLRREEVKSLFLLCSLFPKDFEIPVERLTRFAMALGLFGKIHSNERTRNQVSVAINKLVDSCLLLKGDTQNTIKMHDLVHDVALQIAKTENKMIIRKKELEELSILNFSQIRYLMCDVDVFLNHLNCPKLECLFINTDLENHMNVPDEFFNDMKELRVLAVVNEGSKFPILQLSKSIQLLMNLGCLMLTGWKLGDISFIGSLMTIEELILYHCSFHELPGGVVNLKNLRLLDLEQCKIERNPYGVIKRCLQLEELYFVDNIYPEWGDKGQNSVEFFDKNNVTSELKLQRYHIEIGPSFEEFDDLSYSIKRYLSVQYFDTSFSYATVDDLIKRAEVLFLGRILSGCKSIIPDLVQDGMNELTKLIVHDSEEVECLVNMTNSFYQIGTVFSKLTHLEISVMLHLKNLFLGHPHHNLFQKLEELHINFCHQLKHLIADEPVEILSNGDNPRSSNSVFPKLRVLVIGYCRQLEYLMPISFAKGLLQLENVEIKGAPQMKYVFGQSSPDDEDFLCNQTQSELYIMKLPSLKSLKLESLPNILSIFPENYCPILPYLDSVKMSDCPKLKILLDHLEFRHQDHNIRMKGIVFCNLTKLEFYGLNFLETLFLGPPHCSGFEKLEEIYICKCNQLKHVISNEAEMVNRDHVNRRSKNSIFPILKVISISNCEKLESLMPITFARDLLQLEYLHIGIASQLKYVFGKSNHEAEDLCHDWNQLHIIKLQALKSVKLQFLANIISICPDNYHPIWPSLDSMELKDCPKLNIFLEKIEFREASHTITKNGIVFCNLIKLEFYGLNCLETLFVGQLHHSGFEKLEEIWIYHCNHLKHIITSDAGKINSKGNSPGSYNSIFPRLKMILIENCRELEYLMPVSFAQGIQRVEKLEIVGASQLKYVFGESHTEDKDLFCNQDQNEFHIINLQALRTLKLLVLPNIISICPQKYYPIWPSLEILELKYCPQLNIMPIKNCIGGLELRQQNHTIRKELEAAMVSYVQNLKSLSVLNNSEVGGLFHLQGSPMDGQRVTAGLTDLELYLLPELKYIWKGYKIDWDTYSEILAILEELIAMAPLSNDLEQEKPLPGPLVLPQNPSPQSIKGSIEEIPNLDDANLVVTTLSLATSSESGLLQGQTKTYINEDVKVEPMINLQPFEGTNLVEFHSMEEEEDVPASIPSSLISVNNPDMEANSVAKALADLQVTLKKPLENIASSEAESIRLENTLNFLSSHSCADGALSDGLKAAIESLREDLHSILSSFKQASATIVRFTLLEEKEKSIKEELPRREESAIANMNAIQQKEASLMEQISKLQDELSLLQEQKKKSVADTVRFKSDFEFVKKNKTQMLEDHIKSREELVRVDDKWSALCNQFKDNLS